MYQLIFIAIVLVLSMYLLLHGSNNNNNRIVNTGSSLAMPEDIGFSYQRPQAHMRRIGIQGRRMNTSYSRRGSL